jgi:putative NIF3 family GTP cyclohydrolase 1 type 2
MAVSCKDVIAFVSAFNPEGRLNAEEGVLHGPEDRSTNRVMVAWMPTVVAIRHAIAESCGILLVHEALTFFDYFGPGDTPWTADRARLDLLGPAGITVIRAHSTIDPTHIVPAFIHATGLPDAIEQGAVWSYHEEPPLRLRDLAARVAAGLGLPHVRVTGDPDATVGRIGTMVGGLGLDRHIGSWERFLMARRPDVLLIGETNDFAQRFAVDCPMGLIETCHSASEEPGLEQFTCDLAAALPGSGVLFHREDVPWAVL